MAERITVSLHELVAELDVFADALLRDRYDVSFNLFEYLATLAELEPVDITRLASCLRVSKAAVSKRVPSLVEAGWVTATPDTGRRIVLELTPKGRDLVDKAGGELETHFTAILADPRLNPMLTPGAISADAFHEHVRTLTTIITEQERPS